jgi:hypothetical protein
MMGRLKMENGLRTIAVLASIGLTLAATSATAKQQHFPDAVQFAIDQAYLCGGVEAMRELLKTQGVTSDAPPRPECSNVSPQQKDALRGLIEESMRSAQ